MSNELIFILATPTGKTTYRHGRSKNVTFSIQNIQIRVVLSSNDTRYVFDDCCRFCIDTVFEMSVIN